MFFHPPKDVLMWNKYVKLQLVNECVNMSVHVALQSWHPIHGVFQPDSQCSKNKGWTYQDQLLQMNERINNCSQPVQSKTIIFHKESMFFPL